MRTFLDARDDIEQGSKVSEWLYARFVTPIVIGIMGITIVCLPVESFAESILKSGKESWELHAIIGILLLLVPSILIVMAIRTYELVKTHTSKTT